MSKGFHMWWENYGGLTWIAKDYYDEDVMGFLDTPAITSFFEMLDPIVYKDRYAGVPKLVISSTGDEFFQVMDDHLWYDEVPGKNVLLRAPNSDHFEVTGLTKILPSLVSWMHELNVARAAKAEPRFPVFNWTMWSEGAGSQEVAYMNVTVDISEGNPKPTTARLRPT